MIQEKEIQKVQEENYYLYLDDIGTLWVLDKNNTIHDLNYDTVENYNDGDFSSVNIEALYEIYANIQNNKLHKKNYAIYIVDTLRRECLKNYRILHYAQQLKKFKQ